MTSLDKKFELLFEFSFLSRMRDSQCRGWGGACDCEWLVIPRIIFSVVPEHSTVPFFPPKGLKGGEIFPLEFYETKKCNFLGNQNELKATKSKIE